MKCKLILLINSIFSRPEKAVLESNLFKYLIKHECLLDNIILNTINQILISMFQKTNFKKEKDLYDQFPNLIKALFQINKINDKNKFKRINTNFIIIFFIQNIFPELTQLIIININDKNKGYSYISKIKRKIHSHILEPEVKTHLNNTNKNLTKDEELNNDENYIRLNYIYGLINEIDDCFTPELCTHYFEILNIYP